MTGMTDRTDERPTSIIGEPAGVVGVDDRRSERGFVLAQSALLLIPLLVFAAFATDIGSWYVEGQKVQRSADAAALAGVTFLPDGPAAEAAAREAAAKNGYVDATPGDNTDFDTGPLPQIEVVSFGGEGLEVRIKTEAQSYFGAVVLESIEVERYGVAEYIQPVHLGNPTSGLGTGDINPASLGLPNDQMWLSINAYCSDHEQGDQFATGFYDGPGGQFDTCNSSGPKSGVTVNPTYDSDAYVFVTEYQPGSPAIDIDVYEPGGSCTDAGNTSEFVASWAISPLLNFEVYGPSSTTDHWGFINANAPIATISYPRNACISNSPGGDGWWPLLTNGATPSPNGGYYYVVAGTRGPTTPNLHTGDNFWNENMINNFSLRTVRNGTSTLCAFSAADPTCPQMYALDWLPLYRPIVGEQAFYLAEVDQDHAGELMTITFFDAAEDVANIQFVDSNGTAMPFRWRYTDTTDGLLPGGPPWRETALTPGSDTCNYGATSGNPCLVTSNRPDWNDHFVQVEIDIPDSYTCGADCWWTIRYVTFGNPTDRSTWAISLEGDPVRLVE